MQTFLNFIAIILFASGFMSLIVFVSQLRWSNWAFRELGKAWILLAFSIFAFIAVAFIVYKTEHPTTLNMYGHKYEYVGDAIPQDTIVNNGRIYVLKR